MNNENKGMTVSQYRGLDVFLFGLITAFVELLNLIVFKKFFSGEFFCLSLTVPMALIVMQRWNGWAAFIAIIGGVAYCVGNGAESFVNYVVYIGGNSLILINLLWYKFLPKKKLTENSLLRICFALSGFALVELGRTCISLFFAGSFLGNLQEMLVADGLNIAIGILVVWIAGRQKDLFKDQMEYLTELQEEREKNYLKSLAGGNHEGRSTEESDSERTDTES